ncbi:MAG: hypothetical protein JJ975_08555 [Bacteroidia bacterium]|nr:hypothetical protein [Bacteroidia bacterium]
MLSDLLETGNVQLHSPNLTFSKEEETSVVALLEETYNREKSGFPFEPPVFDPNAAIWAARTMYRAAQLILFREAEVQDLPKIFPAYQATITPEAALSADICLRYLPSMMFHLRSIDSDDPLLEVLHRHLMVWHYSYIKQIKEVGELNFDIFFKSDTLRQLYVDRIIEYKNEVLANHPACISYVKANMGMYKQHFWPALTQL